MNTLTIYGTPDNPVQIESFESQPFVDHVDDEVLEQKKLYWEQHGFSFIHVFTAKDIEDLECGVPLFLRIDLEGRMV